ncbi:MAG: glutathione S-transferase N-terminal domain-containing protein [Oligoflexales bacterium]|nr:glutathione S-transferase N-terminal domain-containing protein [Oligoflexales bacterium]
MTLIRWILRQLITVVDYFFQPKFAERPHDLQQELDRKTANLSIYQFKACPFCVKVRWALLRMGLRVQYLDAKNHEASKQELLSGGGKVKVPCLRIKHSDGSSSWMYESNDIINYFENEVLTLPSQPTAQTKVAST